MTLPQHLQALERGNQIRRERSDMRARVEQVRDHDNGRQALADLLDDGVPACMRSLPVEKALRWVHSMQSPSVRRITAEVGCSQSRLLGELTDRQRVVLVEVLRMDRRARERERRASATSAWAAQSPMDDERRRDSHPDAA